MPPRPGYISALSSRCLTYTSTFAACAAASPASSSPAAAHLRRPSTTPQTDAGQHFSGRYFSSFSVPFSLSRAALSAGPQHSLVISRRHSTTTTTAAATQPPASHHHSSSSSSSGSSTAHGRGSVAAATSSLSFSPAAASSSSVKMSKRRRGASLSPAEREEEGVEEEGEELDSLLPTARLSKAELSRLVAARLELPVRSAAYVLEQAKGGATVPFLARYRQDETGHLDEAQLRSVIATAEEVAETHRRRQFMLKSLEQRGLLTEERRRALERMVHTSQLEDFWEPFKLRKTSLAARAREAGLAPLAEAMLTAADPLPPNFRQIVARVEDGERLLVALLAEELQRCEPARLELLRYVQDTGALTASVVGAARKRAAKEMREGDFEQLKKKYSYYDQRRYPVRHINGHTVLALQRGEARGVLRVELKPKEATPHIFQRLIRQHFPGAECRLGRAPPGVAYTRYERDLFSDGVQAAHDHMLKATVNTIRRDLKKSAEREAIAVFAHNLRHMLLQRPLSHARVLAMDPGISNGVKCVALDESGDVIAFFKFLLMEEERAIRCVANIVESKQLNKIVIGNGTASQQTAQLVAKVIKMRGWRDVEFAVVSEAGASVYSVSDAAKEEFPTLDIMYRGAVSIGRRVMDPLSELVKIPVRSMGIGMYQHDVNEKELLGELSHVVESCVAGVGVNSSSTNRYVMERVPGLTKKLVDQIVLARHNKSLESRSDLRRVPGMTEAVYAQIAGFFRFPNSQEPLDNTNIHPESYPLVRALLAAQQRGELGHDIGTVADAAAPAGDEKKKGSSGDGDAAAARQRRLVGLSISSLSGEALRALCRGLGCGPETLRLVGRELLTPALDPRASLPHAGLLRREIKEAKDLRKGDRLVGVVQSITTFGAFVDCGLHESVLVRGQEVVDRLQVGALLSDIEFLSLDHLGRPQVVYHAPPPPEGDARGGGRGGRLRLESEDVLAVGDGDAQSLRGHLNRARQAAEATGAAAAAAAVRSVDGEAQGAQRRRRAESPENEESLERPTTPARAVACPPQENRNEEEEEDEEGEGEEPIAAAAAVQQQPAMPVGKIPADATASSRSNDGLDGARPTKVRRRDPTETAAAAASAAVDGSREAPVVISSSASSSSADGDAQVDRRRPPATKAVGSEAPQRKRARAAPPPARPAKGPVKMKARSAAPAAAAKVPPPSGSGPAAAGKDDGGSIEEFFIL